MIPLGSTVSSRMNARAVGYVLRKEAEQEEMNMGKITAVVNQKGGVGKTTTAFNLAHALAQKGEKVLLVDMDPQANLTMCCGFDRPDTIGTTIYQLMNAVLEEEPLPLPETYLKRVGGVDLIPSSIELSAMEISLVNAMSREIILKSVLEPLKDAYSTIIIDCMPSLGMLTINALAACDSILIPATPQYLSAKGLEMLIKTISRIRKRINPAILIEGILITQYTERTRLSKEVLGMIKEAYGNHIKVFESRIPVSVRVGESMMNSKSILEFDPNGKVADAYRQLAEEL